MRGGKRDLSRGKLFRMRERQGKRQLQPGMAAIVVTCPRGREAQTVRELYTLLGEYIEDAPPDAARESDGDDEAEEDAPAGDADARPPGEETVEDALQKELASLRGTSAAGTPAATKPRLVRHLSRWLHADTDARARSRADVAARRHGLRRDHARAAPRRPGQRRRAHHARRRHDAPRQDALLPALHAAHARVPRHRRRRRGDGARPAGAIPRRGPPADAVHDRLQRAQLAVPQAQRRDQGRRSCNGHAAQGRPGQARGRHPRRGDQEHVRHWRRARLPPLQALQRRAAAGAGADRARRARRVCQAAGVARAE
eukprot:Unigene10495_Nuclearia_a/m.32087 Unigene10495_Nuclearia_a/g.32087  ORF Unigene10495_Nuclearia_a/g.32087 Unigene10495_Nuclearia_a/m.32087 type:complete len:313 (+) Unigene10495_Nuclearia_a:53-991(+)